MPFWITGEDIGRISAGTKIDAADLAPWKSEGGLDNAVRTRYRDALRSAGESEVSSLAVPFVYSDEMGLTRENALRIALPEIEDFLSKHDVELYLSVSGGGTPSLTSQLYGDIDEYIDRNLVPDLARAEEFASAQVEKCAFEPADKSAMVSKEKSDYVSSSIIVPEKSLDEDEESDNSRGGFLKKRRLKKKSAEMAAPLMAQSMGAARAVNAGCTKRSLEDVVKNLDKSFMELVFSFADERGITDAELQKKANLDRRAFSKLKCGTTKNPGKSTALAIAVALELNLDETKDLLSRAGYALSPCSRQDLIVRYFIEREAYDIYAINIALFEHGEPLLGCAAGM